MHGLKSLVFVKSILFNVFINGAFTTDYVRLFQNMNTRMVKQSFLRFVIVPKVKIF